MDTTLHRRSLSGWGRTSPVHCEVASVTAAALAHMQSDSVRTLLGGSRRGVAVRGLGRAYGDAAQNGGGLVLEIADSLQEVQLDRDRGVVRSPAGVSLDDLISFLVPRGYFVPVTPGTRFVTVGGAVASDIHGKNHHIDGSFGSHVEKMTMLLADGSVQEVTPDSDAALFWATIGGMGLTGAILDVTFRLLPIQTSRCTVSTQRCSDLEDLVAAMTEDDERYKYSVAWTDLLATGSSLGRSILWRGDHTPANELDPGLGDPLAYETSNLGSVPPFVPAPGLVNRWTSTVFNELWFRRAPRMRHGEIKSIPAFFHPLDAIGHWNRLYGPGGFIQYQFVIPLGSEATLRSIVSEIAGSRLATPLVVLKKFGPGNKGMLSFPTQGWTLTVDIAARSEGLPRLLGRLDDMVLEAGGRHYLAKDAHMTPETCTRGYPRLEEWKAVKRRVDPDGIWTSDLARRLELMQ